MNLVKKRNSKKKFKIKMMKMIFNYKVMQKSKYQIKEINNKIKIKCLILNHLRYSLLCKNKYNHIPENVDYKIKIHAQWKKTPK